ncbi:hypothetical protein [Streptomyces sp. SID12488]|uniref:hypothetical protein n=1 Tax=Streptomyces sp. SID12488 TaxID=2706040 RepID=UPI001EF1D5E1|nr:hypothetical protein [Streptomyces sp. SID12488]
MLPASPAWRSARTRSTRLLDVVEQLRLARPDVTVPGSLHVTVRAAAALLPTTPTTRA